MKIKELYVENFGKLSKYRRVFSDGLNAFIEDNGYGKTTLTVFIKAMLYGFDETRRQSLDENDRKKYIPWQGGAFGGWLIFEANGKTYRIERSFQTKGTDDTFLLYDLDTGSISGDYTSSLGEELFGIDADGFERTVFLSEKNLSGKNTNQSISAKLSNLVGTEGDIGGFDAAIKLLDDRRRFYQKKGGAGEIQDLKREISEIEDEIKRLNERKDTASDIEKEIANAAEKIQDIKAKKEVVLAKERREMLENERRGYEIQYAQMLGALKNDEAREEKLGEFFAKKLPSNSEIAAAAESESELKRLKQELLSIGENHELSSLEEFFKAGTDAAECERMAALSKRIAENKADFYSAPEKKADSPFLREPSVSEIDEYSMKLSGVKGSSSHGGLVTLLIGFLLFASGIILGISSHTALFSIAIIGFLLTLVGIIALMRSKSNKESLDTAKKVQFFISEIYGDKRTFESELAGLFTMRAELEKYKLECERALASVREREIFTENTLRLEREVREFVGKFPKTNALTLEEETLEILRLFRRFELLCEYEAERDTRRTLCYQRIHDCEAKVRDFLSLFPTTTAEPINEIRRNLAEYEVLVASLSRRRGDAKRFAASHGISEEVQTISEKLTTGSNFSHELSAINEELLSLEKHKTKLESDYNSTVRDIEKIDELEEKLRERVEQVELFLDNLSVINKAKDLLAKSKDNMTARYLDSTKMGFEKYISLIENEVGDFTIDTSFNVTKNDMGKSRQQEAYSRGTRDLHSLAIRLSLVDALYEGEKPPIILDDPFISFDDRRAERALAVVKKLASDRQIFYFTCSKSRRAK